MTWTRQRPPGIGCIRDFQFDYEPPGARRRAYYRKDELCNWPDAADSWWHPVRADGRYPALPSDETPAPLTPAEETTFQGYPPSSLTPPTAPEPSRLEIAARIMAGFASHPDAPACKSTTPEGIEAERNEYARGIATGCMRWADALIAAARKGGGA